MKDLIKKIFVGRMLFFPKQFIYLFLSFFTLSLSKMVNGSEAFFEGEWVIVLSVVLFLFFAASMIITLFFHLKQKNK
jgi:hypothetical protein